MFEAHATQLTYVLEKKGSQSGKLLRSSRTNFKNKIQISL